MANRKIGQAGLALIKQFEGCRLTAYQCSAGVWTIGYGHTAGVYKGMKKLCVGRNINQIPSAMRQYCKAAGKTLPGLQRRRKAEAALYNKKVENCTGTIAVKESEDYNMKTIKKGSKGNTVKVWQIIIGTTPDGNFGSGTENATKTWQKNHGLTADGIVGKVSWNVGLRSL